MRNTLLDRLERAISGVRLTFARLALLLFCLSGCAPLGHTPAPVEKLDGSAARTASKVAMFTSDGQMLTDLQRLADLWHRRTKGGSISDYPIGPGDVLEISVPGMEELKDRVVRISGEGTITLPFTGTVRAGGLSEHELREEIRRRLANYMYNP